MQIFFGFLIGSTAWFLMRYLVAGLYTVDQNERAVKTIFGRAERLGNQTTLDDPISESLKPEERGRYSYPQVRVIPPGGPYFKWPWEQIYKVNISTQTLNMAFDPEDPRANANGTQLSAVTKDQLDTGLTGQIRYRICEQNLYAFLFGVKRPIVHVMGYYISILRERIANFTAPPPLEEASDNSIASVAGISINDLRKNLSTLNEHMDQSCASSAPRYGITFDASLITGIDPPQEVESALAAINTAHNQVSSDISLAQASADQKIVQSKRAVEIETLNAYAEVEPLRALAGQLTTLRASGPDALSAYRRNVRLKLFKQASQIIIEDAQ
ncbi:MAG: SPFH domain-containing protein [Verrucomicrobiota bacterium]